MCTGWSKETLKDTLKPSNGLMVAYASSLVTVTSFLTLMNFFSASWSSSPADWIKKTKGLELPSIIGTSGPSTLIRQLSTPSPAIAESKCSIVEILTPSFTNAVDRLVSPTFSAIAGITRFSSTSVLIKLMPVFTSDGINSMFIFLPVWRPIPTAFIEFLSVLCFNMFIFLKYILSLTHAVLIFLKVLSQLLQKH